MSYFRALFLATSAGIGSYLCNLLTDNILKVNASFPTCKNINAVTQDALPFHPNEGISADGDNDNGNEHLFTPHTSHLDCNEESSQQDAQILNDFNEKLLTLTFSNWEEQENEIEDDDEDLDREDDCPIAKPTNVSELNGSEVGDHSQNAQVKCCDSLEDIMSSKKLSGNKGCYVYFNGSQHRIPTWVLEFVRKDNVAHALDRHLHYFNVTDVEVVEDDCDNDDPAIYEEDNDEGSCSDGQDDEPLDNDVDDPSDLVKPCDLPNSTTTASNECQSPDVWKHFYDYVTFLTGIYCRVTLLSGPLYLTKQISNCSVDNTIPTHYFKVILCKNKDGTYRFECYKFRNEPTECPKLKDYLVAREILENEFGYYVFKCIKDDMVKEREVHPNFANER